MNFFTLIPPNFAHHANYADNTSGLCGWCKCNSLSTHYPRDWFSNL